MISKSNIIIFNEIEDILKSKRQEKINIGFEEDVMSKIDEIIKLKIEKTLFSIEEEVRLFLMELGLGGKCLKEEVKIVTQDILSGNIDYLILPIELVKYINYEVINIFSSDEISRLESIEFERLNSNMKKRIIDFF